MTYKAFDISTNCSLLNTDSLKMHVSFKLVSSFFLILIGLSLIEASCKITLKVRSATKKPFQIQVYIPSLHQKTERVTFDGPSEKKVQIKGSNCMDKKWVIKTWKAAPDGNWVPAAQTDGKLGGVGTFRVVVDDKYMPYGNDRMGVMCSESNGPLCG